MKSTWIVIVVTILILAGAAYLGRHQLKSLLGNSAMPTPTSAPVQKQEKPQAVPTDNIYKTASDSQGAHITDFAGMSLYVFDKDTPGVSNCSGQCESVWPIYTSGATAQKTFPAHISVITRKDGKDQFAWDNKPLYYYAPDKKPGDILGDGVGGVWHLVRE